jgi:hypothetical protein
VSDNLSKFDELNRNLMDVMSKLVSSQNLCKLLLYTSDNPFVEPDIVDTSSLIFNKIFPIPKLPDTVESVQNVKGSLLTAVFEDIKIGSTNRGFKNSLLCFNIYCHIDLWQMSETGGKLRPFSIMQEIDTLFNDQRVIGLGRMQFVRSRPIAANATNIGYKIDYEICDFN